MTTFKGLIMGLGVALVLAISTLVFAQNTTQQNTVKEKESCCAEASCCQGDSCAKHTGEKAGKTECCTEGCCKAHQESKNHAAKDGCCGDSCAMHHGTKNEMKDGAKHDTHKSAGAHACCCCSGDSCDMKTKNEQKEKKG